VIRIDDSNIPADIPSPPPSQFSSTSPMYLGDIDVMMKNLADKVPFLDSETMYLSELSAQKRIFTIILVLGCMMVIFVGLI